MRVSMLILDWVVLVGGISIYLEFLYNPRVLLFLDQLKGQGLQV